MSALRTSTEYRSIVLMVNSSLEPYQSFVKPDSNVMTFDKRQFAGERLLSELNSWRDLHFCDPTDASFQSSLIMVKRIHLDRYLRPNGLFQRLAGELSVKSPVSFDLASSSTPVLWSFDIIMMMYASQDDLTTDHASKLYRTSIYRLWLLSMCL